MSSRGPFCPEPLLRRCPGQCPICPYVKMALLISRELKIVKCLHLPNFASTFLSRTAAWCCRRGRWRCRRWRRHTWGPRRRCQSRPSRQSSSRLFGTKKIIQKRKNCLFKRKRVIEFIWYLISLLITEILLF